MTGKHLIAFFVAALATAALAAPASAVAISPSGP